MSDFVIFRSGYGKWHLLMHADKKAVQSCSRFNYCKVSGGSLEVGITGCQPRPVEIRTATLSDVEKIRSLGNMCNICLRGLTGPNTKRDYVSAAQAEKKGLDVGVSGLVTLANDSISAARSSGVCPICKQSTELPDSTNAKQIVTLQAGDSKIIGCSKCFHAILDAAETLPVGATISMKIT